MDKYNCDVLVVGGGVAGISAALAGARNNKKVILIEKSFMLGGLATAGLVTIYLPLDDGNGKQVSFGLAEELLKLSIKEYCNGLRGYEEWIVNRDRKKDDTCSRYEVDFDAQLFAMLAEKTLLENNVKILYGCTAVGVNKEKGKINNVIVHGVSGMQQIDVDSVIDCSGDAVIGYMAGIKMRQFGQGNVLAAWYNSAGADGYKLHILGGCDVPDEDKAKEGQPQLLNQRRFIGLDTEEVSEFTQMAHSQILKDVIKKRKEDSSYLPATIATIPQLRMTRCVCGEFSLDTKQSHTYFEDSVGLVSNWKKRGPVYEVPFGILHNNDIKNLLFAGRTVSCTDAMWNILRVIPCCAVTGEACGVATAITNDFSKIDVKLLQQKLIDNGVIIHERDL